MRSAPSTPEFDRDAGRVLLAIKGSTAAAPAAFPAQIEAALAAALALLDSDPDLARRFTSRPLPDHLLLRARHWNKLFATRLRSAAERFPQLTLPPFFLEPHLIDGLVSLIDRELRLADSPDLLARLPGMLEFLLRCYLDPTEVGSLIAARRRSLGSPLP